MQEREIMGILKETEAYTQGHFKLSSGLHSGGYLQCARILQEPILAERFCKALGSKIGAYEPDVVIGPALGGIVFAYEMARVLGARAMFTERNAEGRMVLRRGFIVTPLSRVLVAEDVLTTGRSAKEVVDLLMEDGIVPVGVTSLIDRSAKPLDFGGIKHESLIKLNIRTFDEKECPLCKEGIPLVKPGSRL